MTLSTRASTIVAAATGIAALIWGYRVLFPTDEQLRERGPSSPEEATAHGGVFVDVYSVYDTNERVIGHWVSGAGFVPLTGDVDAVVQSVLDDTTNSGASSGP